MTCVVAASRGGYEYFPTLLKEATGVDFVLISRKADLTMEFLEELAPQKRLLDLFYFFHHIMQVILQGII